MDFRKFLDKIANMFGRLNFADFSMMEQTDLRKIYDDIYAEGYNDGYSEGCDDGCDEEYDDEYECDDE